MSHAEKPTFMKETANTASAAAIRRSEASTRASPPPAAAPLIRATTGWGSRRIRCISEAMCRCVRSVRLQAGRIV